ncbi:MAG: hypothetical protein Q8O67_32475 [Deltaproteobacteria bacterium]|nr:hypothetical protein [Deltaproteobacteria bacterium]
MTEDDKTRALREQLDKLLREHGDVKERVAEYQRRRWLSPGEELELRTLQRLKLRKKDAIAVVERELTVLETTLKLD